jgi:diguanylate cyclase (GGDEF)-like protein
MAFTNCLSKKSPRLNVRELLLLLMIDIDKFKKINDRFGHLAGDGVLCNFARVISDTTMGKGIACRLGGDEFVILLNDLSSLNSVQNLLRKEVQDWKSHDVVVQEMGISIGVAVWEPGITKSVFELLADADRKMYEEKTHKVLPGHS